MFGCTGKILEVDLSKASISEINLGEEVYKKYIGGSGLAAMLFFERADFNAAPLAPGNLLIFMNGPFTGVRFPGASRFSAGARSPLTGIWGDSNCGGSFGPEMKFAGFDGVVFKGKSEKPVYLSVEEGKAELKDAIELWGRDTYETTDILREIHGEPRVSVMAIGPAGENMVYFASIHNDKAHTFGRTGMGAVMGSKNLKALVARGVEKKISLAKEKEFEELRERLTSELMKGAAPDTLGKVGTSFYVKIGTSIGDIPTKNWTLPSWEEGAARLDGSVMVEKYLTRRGACFACPIACKRVVRVKEGPYITVEGPGPEYETIASFGQMLHIDDLTAIIKANELLNRYGMDSISCGATIAWAMECFEKGLLSLADTDGAELKWGSKDEVIGLLPKIAKREGSFASLLANGSRAASQKIGRGSEALTTDVKGLEAPMHDPRALFGLGLAYAAGSTRGACHVATTTISLELGPVSYPEIGLDKKYETMSDEYKAEQVSGSCDIGALFNSACLCSLTANALQLSDWVGLFNAIAGYDWNIDRMVETGARVWYLKRSLNHIFGLSAKDDELPKKIAIPLKRGPTVGRAPDMGRLLREFYEIRELDLVTGKPSREMLENLGLDDIADKLYG